MECVSKREQTPHQGQRETVGDFLPLSQRAQVSWSRDEMAADGWSGGSVLGDAGAELIEEELNWERKLVNCLCDQKEKLSQQRLPPTSPFFQQEHGSLCSPTDNCHPGGRVDWLMTKRLMVQILLLQFLLGSNHSAWYQCE